MAQVLRHLKRKRDPDALVGFDTADDAAVYRVRKDLAVVETVDFFPPVVDDPFVFGQVAAANAMSDIWAMGARPVFALNLVGFPDGLPLKILERILAGGQDKADEAGIPILGGHSVQDPEPKYGMCVTGVVHPQKVLRNSGARPGDALLLTKPLGSGVATTAIKRGVAAKDLVKRVVAVMTELNKAAGEVFASGRFPVSALTDVTGFGLLGHLWEMVSASKVRARLRLSSIPVIGGIGALAEQGVIAGGTRANLAFAGPHTSFPEDLPESVRLVLADAQTNGGLLCSLPSKAAARAIRALERRGVEGAVIGEIVRGKPGIDVLA